MSRFADADAKIAAKKGTTARPNECRMCHLLTTLPADERDDLEALLHSTRSAPHIAAVLDTVGIKLGDSAIKRHRQLHLV